MCSLLPGETLWVMLPVYCTPLHNIWDGISKQVKTICSMFEGRKRGRLVYQTIASGIGTDE